MAENEEVTPGAEVAAEQTPPKKKAKAKAKDPAKAQAPAEGGESSGQRKQRGRSMRGLSKRHTANLKLVEKDKKHPLPDALKLLKQLTKETKFDQTVNIVMHLGIDPKNADQMIRGAVSLPRGIGKKKRVIAFVDGNEADEAKAAGAIEVGVDELIKKVNDGWSEFDVAIAHPRTMGKVGKLGRVLGPQGKMPTPKSGTVTADIAKAVTEFAAGKIEFRNDAGGNVHAVVGKASFADADLSENIESFVGHIRRLKPSTSKGHYIKKVCISGTMSPAIELEVVQ
jgi:large subunit ribosomal protein L1